MGCITNLSENLAWTCKGDRKKTILRLQESSLRYLAKFNSFSINVPLLYPLKTSKTSGFLIFSGDIEMGLKMG